MILDCQRIARNRQLHVIQIGHEQLEESSVVDYRSRDSRPSTQLRPGRVRQRAPTAAAQRFNMSYPSQELRSDLFGTRSEAALAVLCELFCNRLAATARWLGTSKPNGIIFSQALPRKTSDSTAVLRLLCDDKTSSEETRAGVGEDYSPSYLDHT